MGLTEAVQRKLVLFASVPFQFTADLVVQVERISHDRELHAMLMEQIQKSPEIRMQDRIPAGQVKVGRTAEHFAEVQAVVKRILHLAPGHGFEAGMIACSKDRAVFASLVALIRDMPLKRKVRFHSVILR